MISDWDGIEEFVHVAREGSFTGGAETFGASTTHMSRAIARLEARIETQLIVRTTRSMHLSETGRIFFEQCGKLIDDREEALAAISVKGEVRGSLKITCSYALGEQVVAPLVREFALSHPALSVRIDLENDVVDIVKRGYDLAVRTGRLEDSRLIATRIASRQLITTASRNYLAKHGEPGSVAELTAHNCLVGSSNEWKFKNGTSIRPHGRWRCNGGSAVLEACLADMGVCQLPAFYLREHLSKGVLKEVLAKHKPANEPIWAVYPTRKHLLPKVSKLVEHLRSRFQGMLDRSETA